MWTSWPGYGNWRNQLSSSSDCDLYKDRNKARPAPPVETLNARKEADFAGIFVIFRGLTVGRGALIRPPFLQMDIYFNPASADKGRLPDEQSRISPCHGAAN
jgi:hypothetical protein